LIDQLRKRLSEQIPGVALNFTQPIIDTVTESVTGSSADLAVIISGSDLGELRGLADRTLNIVKNINGSTDDSSACLV
jgi:cobalt-zinc-cadmium resistance protein CzcA